MVGREALPTYRRISRQQIIPLPAPALKRGECFLCAHRPELGRWSEQWTIRSPSVFPETRHIEVALKRSVLWKSYADVLRNSRHPEMIHQLWLPETGSHNGRWSPNSGRHHFCCATFRIQRLEYRKSCKRRLQFFRPLSSDSFAADSRIVPAPVAQRK